jgi:hypothetical protein
MQICVCELCVCVKRKMIKLRQNSRNYLESAKSPKSKKREPYSKFPSPNVMCDFVFPIFNLLISVGETEYQSNGSSTHLKLLLVSMLEAGMRQRGSSSGVTVLVPTKWHLDSSTSSPRHPLVRYCMSADMCSMRVEAFGMYSHYVGSDPNVMPHPSEIFIV